MGSTKTVQSVLAAPPSPEISAAVVSAAKPLAGNGFDPARIYASRSPGGVTIRAIFDASSLTAGEAQGSGFVVSPEGYVLLTNSHVITHAGEGTGPVRPAHPLYVEFQDGDRIPAKIVGWDVFDDVGLVKVDPAAHPLEPVPLGRFVARRRAALPWPASGARSGTTIR